MQMNLGKMLGRGLILVGFWTFVVSCVWAGTLHIEPWEPNPWRIEPNNEITGTDQELWLELTGGEPPFLYFVNAVLGTEENASVLLIPTQATFDAGGRGGGGMLQAVWPSGGQEAWWKGWAIIDTTSGDERGGMFPPRADGHSAPGAT